MVQPVVDEDKVDEEPSYNKYLLDHLYYFITACVYLRRRVCEL